LRWRLAAVAVARPLEREGDARLRRDLKNPKNHRLSTTLRLANIEEVKLSRPQQSSPQQSPVLPLLNRLVLVLCVIALYRPAAFAVPSFARQTGYTCGQCHTTPPELTAEGRDFKLNGYVLKVAPSITAEPDKKSAAIDLLSNLPLSVWFQTSLTSTSSRQPGTQNASAEFPQTLSFFLSGAWSSNVGSFLQVTYGAQSDHFTLDNTDIRYANQSRLYGKDLHYGITLNNNPGVEDLWNSTPAWGFPFFVSDVAPTPMASPLISGGLAQDVVGLGGYGLWNNQLYAAATLYRSDHKAASQPLTGTGAGVNIQGMAPYWRVAWQHPSKNNYLEIGTYGIHVSSTPGAVTGPKDSYSDVAGDFQYDATLPRVAPEFFCQKPPCSDVLSLRGTYIRETSKLDATFAGGGASQSSHHLNTLQANAEYHWGNKVSTAAGFFNTTGTTDPVLYAQTPVSGSATGIPQSNGYILNLSWWPTMNIGLTAQYTGYLKFNGAKTNYDGAGRNASANNSAYLSASFLF
jgi:hypothetical protein